MSSRVHASGVCYSIFNTASTFNPKSARGGATRAAPNKEAECALPAPIHRVSVARRQGQRGPGRHTNEFIRSDLYNPITNYSAGGCKAD
ncbi:hypothetical protein EVAR_26565_1 [Eumeta japonica]|uniref:Uncharacterized protein n=1 Tax=Eumeta variegata TaxID=151549 RepID=A0A4C1W5E9_EUMVA|nr:hypothetical protein EVAR_26565_1 [Eumeta japonica]